jgi:hypothetical protein
MTILGPGWISSTQRFHCGLKELRIVAEMANVYCLTPFPGVSQRVFRVYQVQNRKDGIQEEAMP